MRYLTECILAASVITLGACKDSGAEGGVDPGPGPGPVCTDCTPTGAFTGKLPSPTGATLWTAPVTEKILREAAPPTVTIDGITLHAARNEFEPFQVAVNAAQSGTVTLKLSAFTGPASPAPIARVEIRRVGYVRITKPSDASSIQSGYIPDPLEPTTFGAAEPVTAGQNQPDCGT